MKKTIAIIFFAAISIKQYAQIEKGTYLPSISMSASFTDNPKKDTISSTKSNSFSYNVGVGFGKFIKDNLLLISSFNYGHSNSKSDYIHNNSSNGNNGQSFFSNSESIGASLLKYKFLTENFAIRYGASLSISYSETINRYYNYYPNNGNPVFEQEITYSNSLGVTLNLLAGIQYFVSKNLALTGSMGFFSTNYSYSPYQKIKHSETQTVTFSLTPSFNAFSVGLSYYIRPKNQVAK